MKMIKFLLPLFFTLVCGCAKTNGTIAPVYHGPYSQSPMPSGSGPGFSEGVKTMLKAEAEGKKGAMVVAAIDESGVSYFAVGDTGKEALGPPNENTFFEIGSVSKVFTAFALAIAVDREEMKLSDRYVDHIEGAEVLGIKMNVDITLKHLLQHTSGLARLPANMNYNGASLDPYADYSDQHLVEFLKQPNPLRPPGEAYAYSNTGTGILGWILAKKQGLEFSELMQERIFDPLQLKDTTVHLSDSQRLRKAQGYLPDGTKTPGWTFQSLAPAGAIHSTPRDMASFASVFLGLSQSPLDSSVKLMLDEPKRVIKEGRPVFIAFGWHLYEKDGKRIVWHNGRTGSSAAFLGLDLDKKRAIIILSGLHNNVTNIGFSHLGID